MMTSAEFKARIEELEAVAEYVPPAVLGHRLLEVIEGHFDDLEAINIRGRFQALLEEGPPVDEMDLEGKIVRIKLPEIGTVRARLRLASPDFYPDEAVEERHIGRWAEIPVKHEPVEVFDSGIPADATARAAATDDRVDDPEERDEAEYWQEMKERDEETPPAEETVPAPIEPAEDTKACKGCEKEKPLSAYGTDVRTADGRAKKCADCMRKIRREAHAARNGGGTKPAGGTELRPKAPEAGERTCARGMECAAVDPDDLVPTPALLGASDPGPLCPRCRQRAGVA